MDCKKVLTSIEQYFEHKLSEMEYHQINRHLMSCEECRLDFEKMERLFNILSHHKIVTPPIDFTDKIMNHIKKNGKIKKTRQRVTGRLGASFIAAGILLALINVSSIKYNVNDLVNGFYDQSFEINQRVIQPFNKLTRSITELTDNIVQTSNKSLN